MTSTPLSTPGLGPNRGYLSSPQTPLLGATGRTSRSGSVSGSAWQLVEVSGNRPATISRSNQGSPAVQVLESNYQDDGWTLDGGPAVAEPADRPRRRSKASKSWADQADESLWQQQKEEAPHEVRVDEGDFDPHYFLGEWLDNLGHTITVTPSDESNRGGRNRRGDSRRGPSFVASLQKIGVPDKRFTISLSRTEPPEWRCGNGNLVREESNLESLSWRAEDGRVSSWTRPLPDGPVYFDAPPEWNWQAYAYPFWMQGMDSMDGGMYGIDGGMDGGMDDGTAGMGEHIAPFDPDAFNPDAPEFVMPTTSESPALKPSPASGGQPRRHRASPKTTPMPSPAIRPSAWGRTPTPSPMIKPLASPLLQAQSFPPLGPAATSPAAQSTPILLELTEESPDATTSGSKMEWRLPDNWGKLGRFPKDFCITSPMFGVDCEASANMQLAFYPNGSREAEPGHCTVALTRGPESAGIKFEFFVNGRSIGPKVCLGRRYLGDYPKPFDNSEEHKAEATVVTVQVLEIFGSAAGSRRASI